MKTVISLAAFTAIAGTAFAQLNPLPPSSLTDGIAVQHEGINGGATHWDSPSTLGSFKNISTTNGDAPLTSSTYNPLGLTFASTIPTAVTSIKATMAASGAATAGTIRSIFLGESAGWQDDFGYTYSGKPTGPGSFTAFQNISAGLGSPATIAFGDFFDVPLTGTQASTFDYWYDGVGDSSSPSTYGGVYTAFNPANSSPIVPPGNVLWAQSPLMVNTFVPALGAYADVATYLVAFEDWRLDRGSDKDYTDLVVGLQFYNANGLPFGPVPEPSTYGLMGAAGLLGLVAYRRFKKKSTAVVA